MQTYTLDEIRKQVIGNNIVFTTPFGERHMLYVDYTASGRGLKIIEDKIQDILMSYANTHTEDDYSGKYLTTLLHQAEARIKELVHAQVSDKIIMTGSGTTGALKKLQEILGVYIPPVTKEWIQKDFNQSSQASKKILEKHRPVVFIGPYEHHTNELMWREAFVDVVVINLDTNGMIDVSDLEIKLIDPQYQHRMKLASFSAGSNVTGVRTKVYDIARICHKHDTLVFFDFAAVAPYIHIDMHHDAESYFDAIFFSPHKFLGGPGTCGVLIFNEKIYRNDLPPTSAGGGTVVYVGKTGHDYAKDIELREKAGTPPILQAIKAAMVLELKEKIGIDTIEQVETELTNYFVSNLKKIENIELLGAVDPCDRISIVSFNIRHKNRMLHPKFVSRLLNDLFGIQSRAGCSCAGPYGHILLGIDDTTSQKYRHMILQGCEGIKPGWVRVNIHYTLNHDDIDYLLKSLCFIARYGYLFLQTYTFNLSNAEWIYDGFKQKEPCFSLDEKYQPKTILLSEIPKLRKEYLRSAEKTAQCLKKQKEPVYNTDDQDIEELKYFYYHHKK